MARIFVSCAPRDLERSRGLWIWLQEQGHEGAFLSFDKDGEPEVPETEREQKLNEAMEPSLALIAVVTRNWRDSEWRQAEFEKARALHKPIFPIVIKRSEASSLEPGLEELDVFDNSPEQLSRLAAELSRLASNDEDKAKDETEGAAENEDEVKDETETETETETATAAETEDKAGDETEDETEDETAPATAVEDESESVEEAAALENELVRLRLACGEAEAKWAVVMAAARRRRRAMAGALAALAAVSAGLALAERSRIDIRRERNEAVGGEVRLIAGSARRAMHGHDPVRGMLLALEAFETAGRNAPRQVTAEAEATLYSGLANNRERVAFASASPIRMMAFSPDGRFVLTGHGEGTLDPASGPAQIWNARTGGEVCTLAGNNGRGVASAVFNPAADRVLTVGQDGAARLWNVTSGAEVATLEGHTAKVAEAWFSPGGSLAVTRYSEGSIRLWGGQTGAELSVVNGAGGLSSVAFSPDGSRMAVVTREGEVQLWDSQAAKPPVQLHGHAGPVVKVAFSPTGLRVVTASPDRTAHIWDAETGAETALLSQHRDQVQDAIFSPDGVEVLTVSADGEARIWDAGMGAPLGSFKGSPGEFDSVSISPDGGKALTRPARGETVTLWEVRTGSLIARIKTLADGEAADKMSAEFSADGARLLTVARLKTSDGAQRVRLWNTADGSMLADFGETVLAALNPLEPQALTLSRRRGVQLWSTISGKLLVTLAGPRAQVETAAFSPTGATVFTASGVQATVWDTRTDRSVSTPMRQLFRTGGTGGVQSSKSGALTFTEMKDGATRITDAVSGGEISVLRGGEDPLRDLIVSPDGVRVATISSTGQAWLWRVGSGRQLAMMSNKSQGVVKARFSHDGALLVTLSHADSRGVAARVWNARTGELQTELTDHEEELTDAGFSPDGASVITASRDGTARIWRVKGGKARAVLRGHEGEVSAAAFSPDGALAVTAAADGTVCAWNPASGERIAAMAVKPRPSGKEEETSPTEIRFSPDSGRILTRSETPNGRFNEALWDLRTGARLGSFDDLDAPGDRAVFSGDGAYLMTVRHGLKTLWNARTGQRLARSFDHSSQEAAKPEPEGAGVGPIAISLAVAEDGRRVSVRAAKETARELAILDAGADADGEAFAASAFSSGGKAGEAALSPDGALLVTAWPGHNPLLWETKGGRLVTVLEAPEGEYPRAPAFTPDGGHVFASLGRGGGAMWRVFPSVSALTEEAKRAAPRCLTRSERRFNGLDPEAPSWCVERGKSPRQSNASIFKP